MKKTKSVSGRVQWFNNSKGYGFIETDAMTDYFDVHFYGNVYIED